MVRLDLKTKLILAAAVPFLMFLVVVGLNVRTSFAEYRRAKENVNQAELFLKTSALVHELQKERGKSGNFLKGGIEFAEVEKQRALTDTQLVEGFDKEGLKALRVTVAEKSKPAGEVIARYTEIIGGLIKRETEIAAAAEGTSVSAKMVSVTILETAKEWAGRLRANLTGVLAANAPIGDEQLQMLINAQSGVNASLNSTGIKASVKTQEGIKSFLQGPSWKEVGQTIQVVIKNFGRGAYERDPKQFFATISESIDQLAALSRAEVNEVKAMAEEERARNLRHCLSTAGVSACMAVFLIVAVWLTIVSVTRPVSAVVSNLNESSGEISGSSTGLRSAAAQIAAAVTQSAAALQETSAALTEISSMVEKNCDSANRARALSDEGRDQALKGIEIMQQMKASIEAISASQSSFVNEVNVSNQKVSALVNIIKEIREKTAVINDIVFQTKLLSFNASVEAARAGEQGKGFAVVAEEIGNLANMSGKAAEGISQLLERSAEDVQRTVQDTTASLKLLMADATGKVSAGLSVTESFTRVLDQIAANVNSVNQMVAEISTASKEQATGISQVTLAVSQLDEATQQNATASSHSAEAANGLSMEVIRLNEVINSLNQTIFAKAA